MSFKVCLSCSFPKPPEGGNSLSKLLQLCTDPRWVSFLRAGGVRACFLIVSGIMLNCGKAGSLRLSSDLLKPISVQWEASSPNVLQCLPKLEGDSSSRTLRLWTATLLGPIGLGLSSRSLWNHLKPSDSLSLRAGTEPRSSTGTVPGLVSQSRLLKSCCIGCILMSPQIF